MKTVYLVRHAQSQPSHEVEEPSWPLSDRGRAQATRLVEVLEPLGIQKVHTSPYLRCRDTIAPFVAATKVPVQVHDDLRERKVASTVVDNFVDIWQRSWDDFGFAMPGCESSDSAQRRIHSEVLQICDGAQDDALAISSHGNVLALLLNRLDPKFHIEQATAMRNPEIIRLAYADGALSWDAGWAMPALDRFASHYSETPLPNK